MAETEAPQGTGTAPASTPAPAAPSGTGSSNSQTIFGNMGGTATSANDPLRVMLEIANDPKLSEADKIALVNMAGKRFTNRRRMAYIALFSIIGTLIFILGAALLDASPDRNLACLTATEAAKAAAPKCGSILKSLSEAQTLLAWIQGFLASIVAAYYGFSSLRPSS